MMLAKAYLDSEQYEQCEQTCTYMNKTFPNDNTVQIVGVLDAALPCTIGEETLFR